MTKERYDKVTSVRQRYMGNIYRTKRSQSDRKRIRTALRRGGAELDKAMTDTLERKYDRTTYMGLNTAGWVKGKKRTKSINDIYAQVDRIYDNPRATSDRIDRVERAAERYETNVLNLRGNRQRHSAMLQDFDSDKSRQLRKEYFNKQYSTSAYRDGENVRTQGLSNG